MVLGGVEVPGLGIGERTVDSDRRSNFLCFAVVGFGSLLICTTFIVARSGEYAHLRLIKVSQENTVLKNISRPLKSCRLFLWPSDQVMCQSVTCLLSIHRSHSSVRTPSP